MIVQNISQDGVNANVITVPNSEINSAKEILKNNFSTIDHNSLNTDQNVSKISVIGMGMMSQSDVKKCSEL